MCRQSPERTVSTRGGKAKGGRRKWRERRTGGRTETRGKQADRGKGGKQMEAQRGRQAQRAASGQQLFHPSPADVKSPPPPPPKQWENKLAGPRAVPAKNPPIFFSSALTFLPANAILRAQS
ncbi:hypothetical protein HMPREF0262_01226 [Clostridium sp. ATCC 29733]|nr:hypothetical protein HMPREF0262_01226 [Clostridium sp. ATCC 29733]